MFKKGDVVTVRQWDDMAEEYGLWKGCIQTKGWLFIPEMRRICGEEHTVLQVLPEVGFTQLKLDNVGYHISDSMVTPIVESGVQFSEDDWNNLMEVI